jgi:hypothetical protein
MSSVNNNQQEVYSQAIKAGRRTYFFDVKTTLNNDYFITFTESKKTVVDGKDEYSKHKLFIYKEDFEKVLEGLANAIDFAKSKISEAEKQSESKADSDFTFEDLK